jgi:hypothetical protein
MMMVAAKTANFDLSATSSKRPSFFINGHIPISS